MDTIGDFLTKIRNAQAVGKEKIEVPYSSLFEEVAKLLSQEGYVGKVHPFKPKGKKHKMLSVELKYIEEDPAIYHIKRISKPGQRIYKGSSDLPSALGGKGLTVVSTSRGLMSAKEARKRSLGGEVMLEVW